MYQRTAASSKAFIKKKCCIVNIQIYKYIQTYKCVLTEGQKVLFCQFKINIPTCWSASTNWILVRQRRMKSQEILYSKSNKKCVCLLYIYTYIHTHIYTYTFIHTYTYTYTHIYTNIHTFAYIHRHIHIHITNARIHTYISIHRCTRTHDYAHVHAIIKMQLKIVLTHACKCTCEQPHAHRHVCPRAHIYAHTYVCMLSLSLPDVCSL